MTKKFCKQCKIPMRKRGVVKEGQSRYFCPKCGEEDEPKYKPHNHCKICLKRNKCDKKNIHNHLCLNYELKD